MPWDLATLVLTVPIFALSFAHVLEWPGKRRLERSAYVGVQLIYYPGFTIVGMLTELPAVVVAVVALLVEGPTTSRVVTVGGLVAVSLLFWLVVQPVNRHWGTPPDEIADWTRLRARWETGHALRAAASAAALAALLSGLVSG